MTEWPVFSGRVVFAEGIKVGAVKLNTSAEVRNQEVLVNS